MTFENTKFAIFLTLCCILCSLEVESVRVIAGVRARASRSLLDYPPGIDSLEDNGFRDDNFLSEDGEREVRELDRSKINIALAGERDQYDDTEREKEFKVQFAEYLKQYKGRNSKLYMVMNEEANIPLRRMTYTSKYLWDMSGATVVGFDALKIKCEEYGLTFPEIRSNADFKTLAVFLASSPTTVVGLGVNYNVDEGVFVYPDDKSRMGFQMFDRGEPSNTDGGENCVTFRVSTNAEVVMSDVKCGNTTVSIVCQRRTDSLGYADSAEEVAREKDGLDMIGDAGSRRYYIGHVQKKWETAKKYCEENGKQLLDLGTNETENNILSKLIVEWRTAQSLQGPTGFWTSGQFKNNPLEKSFTWQSKSTQFNVTEKRFSWGWILGEPLDQGGKGHERCVDISIFPGSLVPNFRASNCHLPFYYVCYEDRIVDPMCQENGPMRFTGPFSKFVYHSTLGVQSREEAQEACAKWDYELAEIESYTDLQHLQQFVKKNQFESRIWHLGLTDKDLEGEFRENYGDEIIPLKYQSFSVSEPDNQNNEDCVVLVHNNGAMMMEDKKCAGTQAHVLCQFQHTSDCFTNSLQSVQKPADNLWYFGETAVRRYFLSATQKTWIEAMKSCSERKMKLLDSLFLAELGDVKNKMFYPMFIGWAKKYRVGIWTSGRYMKSVEDGQFRWETTLQMFKNNDKSLNFTWAPGEPSDSTKRRMEICIQLTVSHWANMNPSEPLVPMLKASNCRLPNYFVCYEDAPHVRHCHVPPTIDVGFKVLDSLAKYIYMDIPKKMQAKERTKICKYWGLEVAEISSERDYQTISTVLDSWNATSLYFGLGLNSVGSEGEWFEGNGVTPIRFHAFGNGQPLHYQGFEPLDHVVFNKKKSPVWQMTAASEKMATNVLCQFRPESSSFLDKKGPKNYLVKLKLPDGSALNSSFIYYMADAQHTWESARQFCWSRGMNLLDLKVSKSQAQGLFEVLQAHLQRKNMHSFVVRFWTSGKYVETFEDNQFRWETTGTFARHEEIERDIGVSVKPPPNATVPYHRCLSLGLGLEFKQSGGGGNGSAGRVLKTNLKASNCYLTHYVVCSKVIKPKPSDAPQSTATPPEAKHRDPPPCKLSEDPVKQKMQTDLQKWIRSFRPPGVIVCDDKKQVVKS